MRPFDVCIFVVCINVLSAVDSLVSSGAWRCRARSTSVGKRPRIRPRMASRATRARSAQLSGTPTPTCKTASPGQK